ncbi:MAG: SIMPL domain-containing protein [Solitalea-like symbiont of Acarus siro]
MENNQFRSRKKLFFILLLPVTVVISLILSYGLMKIGIQSQRFISVKGLSERKITSNFANWNLTFTVNGKTVQDINKGSKANFNKIKEYFKSHGFNDDQIQLSSSYLNNQSYENTRSGYEANITVNVFTNNIDNMKDASKNVSDLYSQGVQFSAYSVPSYTFTDINKLKPEMIAEAIANAQQSAQKFIETSKVKLGDLKNASQGYFEFLPSDRSSASQDSYPDKILRVVVGASYYLK